ncbi:hypothetical protein Y032_0174g473 [Ancylostoma ceylanicum]|nr:hypothetical protein Y032_0174g473 [Ancylostoma ceylanicum]
MTVLRRVTQWVTLSAVLLLTFIHHHVEAVNSTTVPTTVITSKELAADHAIERSVQLEHLEASGTDDVITGDVSSLAVLSHMDTPKDNIRKRAADFYNGVVGAQFYFPFDIKSPRFPPNAVMGLSRALQRGGAKPHMEFVAQW